MSLSGRGPPPFSVYAMLQVRNFILSFKRGCEALLSCHLLLCSSISRAVLALGVFFWFEKYVLLRREVKVACIINMQGNIWVMKCPER